MDEGEVTVVQQNRLAVSALLGLFVVVFLDAAIRGGQGATTAAGRVAAVGTMGAVVVVLLAVWALAITYPTRLEITSTSITSTNGKPRTSLVLQPAPGDQLRFTTVGGFRSRTLALTCTGEGLVLPLRFFGQARVRAGCEQRGWTFA